MSDTPYSVPAAPVEFSEEIKKSRFITYLAHTSGVEAARGFIQQVKEQHPTARHHCWAYVAGRPEDSVSQGFSDDGEPSGTAGKPILAQLNGANIGEITAVVVRYSGGIKLGTGGLVKAYGGGAQQALKLLLHKEKVVLANLTLSYAYPLAPQVEHQLQLFGATTVSSLYQDDVTLDIQCDIRQQKNLVQALRNATKDQVHIHSPD